MTAIEVGDRYDVIIAGARVAGASTALLLARQGARVLVVDPVPPERDALSTHALMRAGVLQLHRWGVLDAIRQAGTPLIRTTVFHYGDERVAIPIKPTDGVDGLYAPRRTVLDRVLVDAATAAGADVVHGIAVLDLVRGRGGRVVGATLGGVGAPVREVRARWVVGADGVRSRIARLVDSAVQHTAPHAAANIYGYFPDVRPGEYHWHFNGAASAGTISTNDRLMCVFGALPAPEFERRRGRGLATLYRRIVSAVSPELGELVQRNEPVGKLRAFAGIPAFMRRSAGPGWALVGDAGYFKDPATAHGITDALRDAELVARAVLQSSDAALEEYQTVRDQLVHAFMTITDRIASFECDFDELKTLHLAASREMNRGAELVRTFDARETSLPPAVRDHEGGAAGVSSAAA